MASFWAMGGYGGYVWTAFAFTILVLGGLLWQSRRFARKQAALLAGFRSAGGASPVTARRPVVRRLGEPAGAGGPEPGTP